MSHHLVWLAAALMIGMLAAAGLAEQDTGIPPMLETQRPLAQPSAPAKPQSSSESAGPVDRSDRQVQTKKGKSGKVRKPKAAQTSRKKTPKPVKKKGVTAKPRGKAADRRS